jgi:hypothetical protein
MAMQFICFSSGAQRRYRDDIVRAMAMPAGCELTFRYRAKYISHSVQEFLRKTTLVEQPRVLVCYLDQSERQRPVDFIPIRFARLIEAPIIGDFVVLRMRVEQFAFTPDVTAFNRDIHLRSSELPKWSSSEADKYAQGAFWVEVNEYPKSVGESDKISEWQQIVNSLLTRSDFAEAGPFYQIVRLQDVQSKTPVIMKNGQFDLRPNLEYELLIDHYLPKDPVGNFQLGAGLSGDGLAFITGTTIQVDSPYDRHWLRFKTSEPLRAERAVITISKKESAQDAAVQFDLPILVGGARLRAVLIGLAVGVLLAVPQVTTAWVNPSFANRGLGWLIGLSSFIAIFNVAVGIAAAINFRRPI